MIKRLIQSFRNSAGEKQSPSQPELDDRLAAMERVFRAPPLTAELAEAIKLISPHCDFTPTGECRALWEADQNGACWGEYEALLPLFRAMPKPAKILEIGPGMGRSLVFFGKKLGWEGAEVHAFEGEGRSTKYTVLGPRFEDSFCGNLDVLRSVLEFNGVGNVNLFSAADMSMRDLPGPYDLIYSFYSIGFHWALDHFLDDILPLLHENSVAIFTVPPEFKPFPAMKSISFRIVDWKTVWPKEAWLKLLIVSKSKLPEF
jgi:hypothetical protein